jgi:hypothetical protein
MSNNRYSTELNEDIGAIDEGDEFDRKSDSAHGET